MFRHNFLVALRGIKKNTSTFIINTVGLALGLCSCLLVSLYIHDELTYDQHHPNIDNLYRVVLDININGWQGKGTALPPMMAKTLVEEIPEVENAARLNPYFGNAGSNLVRKESETENKFEEKFIYADQSFFEMFHLPLVHGDGRALLQQPNQMVISEKMANKYFPQQNPVGQSLVLNDDPEQTFHITGVAENIPSQSHFDYDFFLSMPSLEDSKDEENWLFNNYFAYLALKPGTDPAHLQTKFKEFSFKHLGPQFKDQQNIDLKAIEKDGQYYRVNLQPVSDIHLHSEGYAPQLQATGDIRNVRMFGAIALFLLLIAMVNFVNLSTAQSSNRAREVGVRKVLGSQRKSLVSQFLWESIFISFLAFLVAVILAELAMPFFNNLSGKELSLPFGKLPFILLLIGAAVVIGVLAGLYPSFYLSAFHPVKVLKGKLSKGAKGGWLRGGLVVVQFAISIGLIVGTLVVSQQMSFIQNKKLGFDKEQVLLIQDTYTLDNQLPAFKAALKNLPEAKNATLSSYLPLEGGNRNSISFYPEGKDDVGDQVLLQTWRVDHDYINTLGMEIIEGREFNINMPTDSQGVMINATAALQFGISDNPIGQRITSPYRREASTVIGVVEDFNFESLKGEVGPVGLFLGLSNSVMSVKANTSDIGSLIEKSEKIWKSFAPNQPFRYDFMDDRFAQMYVVEKRTGNLFMVFTGLAIFIACLGLLALATFMTDQRTKEIGIRKVLGATTESIVSLLSKDFIKFVLIAFLVATPLAYFFMEKWLQDFAYRIDLQWWVFLLAGGLALIVAFFTVGFQSIKAALANPVEALRSE